MSRNIIDLTDALYDYLQSVSVRENPLLRQLREETAELKGAAMQVSPVQGQFMALLVKLLGARRIIEVGVFTGYSSTCMALAMPEDGRLIACDVNEDYTNIAKRYWELAGVNELIELRLAPALDTLEDLAASGMAGTVDFMFIDAVKEEYQQYFEYGLKLLRPGGVIGVDNVLWGGSVINPDKQNDEVKAIRAFNSALHEDDRVDISMLPIGDGLTLARKI